MSKFYNSIFKQSIDGSPYDLKIPLFVKTSGGCGLVFEKKIYFRNVNRYRTELATSSQSFLAR